MPLSPSRWKQFTESRYAHEREALDYLRDNLPDQNTTFVYSNFEFVANDGSVNEIDALVVTQAGVFLVEMKSRGGIVAGNRHLWDWTRDGHTITVDSPLILANAKARKLASLLAEKRIFGTERPPRIEALIFLSAPGISVRLPESERMHICEREPRNKRPGILPALTAHDYFGSASAVRALNQNDVRAVAKALEAAGIRQSPRLRSVGDYVLQELIDESEILLYQDFHAAHPTTEAVRRVRLYTVANKDKAVRETARRLALQEFQILESLDHPQILRALDFQEHELGPAILFRREPNEIRLDHFLRQRGATLPLDIRLTLIRQIGDAVRYAHSHRVLHRALSPKSILVVHPDSDDPQIRVFNWQSGRVLPTGQSSGSGRATTIHATHYSEETTLCYLAPETIRDSRLRDPQADVFSLGAIAFHILSGRPPAANASDLDLILKEHNGLALGASLDGSSAGLQNLVREATHPELLLRTESARDFLDNLDKAEDELTAPPREALADPLDAKPGEMLPHQLKVLKRLGGGALAVALLVQRGNEILVLKCARKAEDNHRIEKEFQTLSELRHELIVTTHGLLSFPSGNHGFLMEYAGEWDRKKDHEEESRRDTLARELKTLGRLSLEFLGRFGEDLLQVVQYLEEKGIAHRDLKPDNIGIKEYGKKLHLKVFDFSLSSAPLDNVRVGTHPYIDPFLPLRRRWDTAAERFSAAVILYEMATGTTPRWGDGQSAPHLIDADVTIESDFFDAPVRYDLNKFFQRCFDREARKRFDNAADMLLDWQNIFHRAAASDSRAPDELLQVKALEGVRPDTLVSQLGLSSRALNTLDRQGILTAQQLADEPPGRFSNLRGVGNKTRRELMDLVGKLRSKLPQAAIPPKAVADKQEPSGDEPAPPLSIDALTALLIPAETSASGKVSRQILAAFLELSDSTPQDVPTYPTQTQVAEKLGKTRAQVGQIIGKARGRWRRTVPQVTPVRTELAKWLEAEGGVAHIAELTQFLLASRGSDAPPPLARRRAAAVVRAALEAEKLSESCSFEERRRGNLFLIALSAPAFSAGALDDAERIAEAGAALAAADPLPAPERVLTELRAVPTHLTQLRDDRLIRLAAAHATVAISPRLELYPKHMDALRALKLAQSALAGVSRITAAELASRVHDRYPEAQPLPPHPELQQLVREAALDLNWSDSEQAYLAPPVPAPDSSTTFERHATVVTTGAVSGNWVAPIDLPPGVPEAFQFENKLRAAYQAPSYLVMATEPRFRYLEMAIQNLSRRFPMQIFHCEREFLKALREEAEAKRVRWEVVLRADSAKPNADGPQTDRVARDWDNLRRLAGHAARRIFDKLRARTGPVLLLFPGLLSRYGQLAILEDLADELGDHSLWVLAGSDGQSPAPTSDGQPIPARPNQSAWIPEKWLNNEFQKYKPASFSSRPGA